MNNKAGIYDSSYNLGSTAKTKNMFCLENFICQNANDRTQIHYFSACHYFCKEVNSLFVNLILFCKYLSVQMVEKCEHVRLDSFRGLEIILPKISWTGIQVRFLF